MARDFLERAGVRAGDHDTLKALPVGRILALQGEIIATDLAERDAPGGRAMGNRLDSIGLERLGCTGLSEHRRFNLLSGLGKFRTTMSRGIDIEAGMTHE